MTTNFWMRGDYLAKPCTDQQHGLRAVGQWSLTTREFDPDCSTCEKRNRR